MKHTGRLLLGILVLIPVAAAAQKPQSGNPPPPAVDYFPKQWKEFSSREGRFRALFPGTPDVFDTTEQTADGPVVLHWCRYKGVISEDVMYIDSPVDVEDPSIVKGVFDIMRDVALANAAQGKPRVVNETNTPVDCHAGRFLRIKMIDNTVLRIKFVAVKNRVYTLIAGSEKCNSRVMGS